MLTSPVTRKLRVRSLGLGAPLGRGLGDFTPSLAPGYGVTAAYSTQIQGAYAQASSSTQAYIKDATGVDTTNQTVSQGASSAATLLQNGYNPDSSSDNANLVHAISGGLCLIPGVGPILGAYVEGLWVVGNAIAAPLQNAFASIGMGVPAGAPPCTTNGKWTTSNVLATNAGALPPLWRVPGTFASLAVPALAYASSMLGNCQKTPPADAIVDACVALWNASHTGTEIPYYVPSLIVQIGSLSAAPGLLIAGAGESVSGTTPAAVAGLHPNVYYAFNPIVEGVNTQYVGVDWTHPPTAAQPYWLPLGSDGPFQSALAAVPPGFIGTMGRIVTLKNGAAVNVTEAAAAALEFAQAWAALTPAQIAALKAAAAGGSAAPTISAPAAAGLTALAAAVAVGAGGSLYAFLTNQAIGYFWGKVFDGAIEGGKKLFGMR